MRGAGNENRCQAVAIRVTVVCQHTGRRNGKHGVLGPAVAVGHRDRGVIDAVDGDGDSLAGGAVLAGDGKAVGIDGASRQMVLGRVVDGVRPVAVGIDAVAALRCRATGCHGLRLPIVRIGHRERARGRGHVVFCQASGRSTGDRRRVVGAVDGNGDGLAGGTVLAGYGEAVGVSRTRREVVLGIVVDGVRPIAVGIDAVAALQRRAAGCRGVRLAVVRIGYG